MAAVKENIKVEDENIGTVDSELADGKDKKKKDKKKKNKDDGDKKSKKGLIIILISILVIGGIAAAIILNVGNVRDAYVIPMLRNIPILGKLIPSDIGNVDDAEDNTLSNDQLVEKNKELEEDITLKDSVISELNNRIESQNSELDRLREIEQQQAEFRQEKDEFDRLVALGEPIDYKNYYESILPENADQLYREVVQTTQNSRELKDYVAKFESMKASNAAAIMEEMLVTDMDLVVLILKNIDTDQSASILAAMATVNAASVAKQLSPPQ